MIFLTLIHSIFNLAYDLYEVIGVIGNVLNITDIQVVWVKAEDILLTFLLCVRFGFIGTHEYLFLWLRNLFQRRLWSSYWHRVALITLNLSNLFAGSVDTRLR